MVAATFGTTAWADGTHGSTFTVKNQSGGKILVSTYNGDDSVCITKHKTYTIDNGGERTAKCHGNGTGRCKFNVVTPWTPNTWITNKVTCGDPNSDDPGGTDKVHKGETCTITGRKTGDYDCQ